MAEKITNEKIKEQFKKIHGDKYNYSMVNYINARTHVRINCSEHGEFSQTPDKHKNGAKCPECVGNVKLSTEEVIKGFQKVHGNKYNYSMVNYINAKTPITIICQEHGKFQQTPNKHKTGDGCPDCGKIKSAKNRTHAFEKVKKVFKDVHGNKYDYSLVEYINGSTPITIICRKHGEFQQTPNNHKMGGCSKCADNVLLSNDEIIEKFRKVHGNRYDYSNVDYINTKTPVSILCPEHGKFQQSPSNHLRKKGCRKCAGNAKLINDELKKEFKNKHGEAYDYSEVNYINALTPVTIICPQHGAFEQIANNHKKGHGCEICGGKVKLTQEQVLSQFHAKHGNKYNYSEVDYINNKTTVKIICSQHGEFIQLPEVHKTGSGCPTCNVGWSKEKIIQFVNSIDNYELLHMDTIEYHIIIGQGKLPNAFNELAFDDYNNRDNSIKLLKERLEAELAKGILESSSSIVINTFNEFNVDEAETIDIAPDTDITNEKKLLTLSNNNDLHVLDNKLVSSCDEEAVNFFIQYKLRKIWNQVLNNDFDIEQLRNESGGKNFIILKNYFFEEYNEVIKYIPPYGYKFPYNPNLMQKLTVYRMLKNRRYGNWSGTGAGKTISFILSSREIGAKLTVLIGVNSTIEQLKESIVGNETKGIQGVFPDSKVFTHYKKGYQFDQNFNNYLILNYDKFQQGYSEELFQDLTDNNKIDFIAIDEIHNVKQRTADDETIRRGTLKRLIGRASENNANLYVLGMSATPVINNLTEAKSLLEIVTGRNYSDFGTKRTLANALEAFKHLTLNGLRYLPKYDIQLKELTGENIPELRIGGTDILEELLSISNNNYLKAEQLILKEKLKNIKPFLGSGVMIYSYFTTGMINQIEAVVKAYGFSVGTFTGEESNETREDNKNKFLSGEIDILIGSKPVGTGVDGLQKICKRMIVLSLPWTDSEYTQLKGRIYRQGSNFGDVDIIIPQVFIQLEDIEWSWDMQRINLIRHKKTLADAAIDGVIPSRKLPSLKTLFKKSQEALLDWKNRVNEGKILKIDRKDLTFPLKPEIVKQLGRRLGDFSEINKNWSISKSKNTHDHLKENPEDWYYYHTLYAEKRKSWDEIPYIEIGKMIKRKEFVIADLGCGEDLLRNEIPDNKVLSFDHIAINGNVTACDISQLPLEDESVDVTVFSLALMGTNFKDYLSEGFRILKSMGFLIIAEPITKWEQRQEELENVLTDIGFNKPNLKRTNKFIYITSIKFKL